MLTKAKKMERTKEQLPILEPAAVSPEGGFQFQVVADQVNKKVVLNFGPKAIQWIGMEPADARGLANLLLHVAAHAELPVGEAPQPIITPNGERNVQLVSHPDGKLPH